VTGPLENPLLGPLQGQTPQGHRPDTPRELHHPVHAHEERRPARRLVPVVDEAVPLALIAEQFVDPHRRRKLSRRPERRDDRQRHDHGPCPGAGLGEIEVEPLGQENDLRWDLRQRVPRDLPEASQEKIREAVAVLGATPVEDRPACPDHVLVVWIVTHQLQRGVRLDRG
jgi:hypothetical protein